MLYTSICSQIKGSERNCITYDYDEKQAVPHGAGRYSLCHWHCCPDVYAAYRTWPDVLHAGKPRCRIPRHVHLSGGCRSGPASAQPLASFLPRRQSLHCVPASHIVFAFIGAAYLKRNPDIINRPVAKHRIQLHYCTAARCRRDDHRYAVLYIRCAVHC